MKDFKVIIVEDVPLELKGTEGILRSDVPEAEIIGTAATEAEFWRLIKQCRPDLVLLDLGLGGSTTVGVEICRQTKESYPNVKILIFTGEILNEKLWVDALDEARAVYAERLYYLQSLPVLYLLSSDKHVLLKDTSLREILDML